MTHKIAESKNPCGSCFNPDKHLRFSQPKKVYKLEEFLLNPPSATSPVAITEPFPLFTEEGVQELRSDIFRREVVDKHGRKQKAGIYIIRGSGVDTPFVYDAWNSEALRQACSRAAGVELQPVFDYDIAHTNVQLGCEAAKYEDIYTVLPSPKPPKQTGQIDEEGRDKDINDNDAVVGDWHNDVYPWVCVLMISDPTGMHGGETALRKGDGSIMKVRGPELGYAVMMQGGSINHAALKQYGKGERITMVTSFRPLDPLVLDGSTLGRVKIVSDLGMLFKDWTTYRLKVVMDRAEALRAKIEQGSLPAEKIKREMQKWVQEQDAYLKFTLTEMED